MIRIKKESQIQEESLYDLWQSFCLSGKTTKDKRLRGIYAGKLNKFDGPDFQGAEFELDCKIYRGDIEIHCHSKDWFLHGHHLDSRYDRVVLHLVWFPSKNDSNIISTSKQLCIPTLSLQKLPITSKEFLSPNLCYLPNNRKIYFDGSLRKFAIKRLLDKARNCNDLSLKYGNNQALYILLLRMLGIPHNVNNFERLSNMLPWEKIQEIKQRFHLPVEGWIALLLIQSGLIDKKLDFKHLKQYVSQLPQVFDQVRMSAEVWKMAGQRPPNNPIHRLLGLAHFVQQFPSESFYYTLSEIIYKRERFENLLENLYILISPNKNTYLNQRFPFSYLQLNRYWGKAFMVEIIGNVFIPFFYNEAYKNNSFGFANYLEELFLFLPATFSYSVLNPYYKWPEIRQKKFYTNQALLSMHTNYCTQKLCKYCPLCRIPEMN